MGLFTIMRDASAFAVSYLIRREDRPNPGSSSLAQGRWAMALHRVLAPFRWDDIVSCDGA